MRNMVTTVRGGVQHEVKMDTPLLVVQKRIARTVNDFLSYNAIPYR